MASLFLLDKIHTGREEEAEWDDEGIDREKERKRWRVEEKKKTATLAVCLYDVVKSTTRPTLLLFVAGNIPQLWLGLFFFFFF